MRGWQENNVSVRLSDPCLAYELHAKPFILTAVIEMEYLDRIAAEASIRYKTSTRAFAGAFDCFENCVWLKPGARPKST